MLRRGRTRINISLSLKHIYSRDPLLVTPLVVTNPLLVTDFLGLYMTLYLSQIEKNCRKLKNRVKNFKKGRKITKNFK